MSDKLRVRDMTIHDCSRVEVEVDHENGCVQVICFGPGEPHRTHLTNFTLTLFSPDDAPPELAPVTYVDPPQDEDQDEEKTLEYADKHGA